MARECKRAKKHSAETRCDISVRHDPPRAPSSSIFFKQDNLGHLNIALGTSIAETEAE